MHHRTRSIVIACLLAAAGIGAFAGFARAPQAAAQTASDLQARIDQRTQDIKKLEQEIAAYEKEINALGTHAATLSSTIKSLELTRKKLEADIAVSENKIAAKNLEIQKLSSEIGDKTENIADNRRIVSHSLVTVRELQDASLAELLLGSRSLSAAWNSMEEIGILQSDLTERIEELRTVKADLEYTKRATEKAKAELVQLKTGLENQKKVNLATAAEQSKLLKDTKQSEAQFQAILNQKKALRAAFEKEVLDYESQLKLIVDPSKIPHSGAGVLSWPLDSIFVTQYFGNTSFATANPQIYNGRGHTGVDFRAAIGTPVKAALSGVVSGVGDTDLVRGCYSYGRWVMVKHPNGLSTLYAHLSLATVKTGQSVTTGQIVGYSGNTGYSTGPHLHFGVYATEGVQIAPFNTSVNCKGALIPLADFKAYLNPLSYL